MSLSPVKQEILEALLLSDKPVKAADLATDVNLSSQAVRGHILGLTRVGYICSPEKSQYAITAKGKAALGLPETTKEEAAAILAYSPHDKAFHFYTEVGKPTSLHAHNLRDFAHKIEKTDVASVEFHTRRGDFEAWFISLGDRELAKKAELLKKKNLTGEDLRKQLHQVVQQRYVFLANLAGQPVYTD
jgi:predicted transcriptional regulator